MTFTATVPPALQSEADSLLVIALCAAWCKTCTEFSAAFDEIAAKHPDHTFVWLDIEDDEAIAGDIDVETFPTLAIYAGSRLVHFGTSLPHRAVLTRLLKSYHGDSPTILAESAVQRLASVLHESGSVPSKRRPRPG